MPAESSPLASRANTRTPAISRDSSPFADELLPIAPVAIFWPIRNFQADSTPWRSEDSGPRRELNQLVLACLQAQVGVHLLDEAQLLEGEIRDGQLCVGQAKYEILLIPPTLVMTQRTLARLAKLRESDIRIHAFGDALIESKV